MSTPPHGPEHIALMQLLGNQLNKSTLIEDIVLITVGVDGRPCVGSSYPGPEMITQVLQRLVDAQDSVDSVVEVDIPKDN